MNLLDNIDLNTPAKDYPLFDKAFALVNNYNLSFKQKIVHIDKLNDLASGKETELFGDVYSSLSTLAASIDERKLLSGM